MSDDAIRSWSGGGNSTIKWSNKNKIQWGLIYWGEIITTVTQNSHWFIQLDRIRFDEWTNTYVKAVANTFGTLWRRHVIEVVDVNTIKISKNWVFNIPNSLPLWDYVLSPSVAWWYTQTIPSTPWQYVLYGMEVISNTKISFSDYNGILVWASVNISWFKDITNTVYSWWSLISFTADWQNWTLTYKDWMLNTANNGVNTWTITYIWWKLYTTTVV